MTKVDPAFQRLVKAQKIPKRGYSGNEGRTHPGMKHWGYAWKAVKQDG